MITDFKIFESIDESGVFSVIIDGNNILFHLRYSDKIYIMIDEEIYQELSIELPKSKGLDENEFFMNPDVDENIINVLIDENFIEVSDEESIAGEQETKSYRII